MNLAKTLTSLLGKASPSVSTPPSKGYLKIGSDVVKVLETLTSPNRYYIQFIQDGQDLDVIDILCKSVSFPEVTRTAAEYWKHGIKYDIPMELGLTNEFSATFSQADGVNDVRTKFLKFLEHPSREASLELGQYGTKPITKSGASTLGSYISNFLGAPPPEKEYYIINKFKYSHVFVKNVGAVELSSSATENPDFTVTFGFAWMTDVNSGAFNEDHYSLSKMEAHSATDTKKDAGNITKKGAGLLDKAKKFAKK